MQALWVFLPVLGASIAHAPVLRFGLLESLDAPLDGGLTVRDKRLFGDNKTWRGAVVMFSGTLALTCLLSRWPFYWSKLPDALRAAGPLVLGALLGFGVVAGELPNSFLKRQLDIAPGSQRRSALGAILSIYDQADFVPVIWLLLLPLWAMPVGDAVIAFAVVAVIHLGLNLIGYVIGARKTAI